MNEKLIYLYAAIKSGIVKNDTIGEYFSLLANIILKNKIEVIDENQLMILFNELYGTDVSVQFIRQVLNIGLSNNSIREKKGQYVPDLNEMKKYNIDDNDFNKQWNVLVNEFLRYTRKNSLDISKEISEEFILNYFSNDYGRTLIETDIELLESPEKMDVYWCKFLGEISTNKKDLFDFVTYLSLTSLYRETMFYNVISTEQFSGLNIYLDTPILFAVLGMDTKERQESYIKLINSSKKSGCSFFVFDNVYEEARGILESASQIAFSDYYDISKANKVAQFFHDEIDNEFEANEYVINLEERLNSLDIFIKETNYDFTDNQFQEDEKELSEMLEQKYIDNGTRITSERLKSIQVDVRSIIMVYRERKGRNSTTIKGSKELLITINSALANVSKLYESNRSIIAGHIPAAITADLLGTLVWLNTPREMVEYKKKQLLSDCYSVLKPNKKVLQNYIKSLENARMEEAIDEDKYLFLRSHPLVKDALMNVTHGDYSRFSDRTYMDVYDEIVESSMEKFYQEKERHSITKELLNNEKLSRQSAEKEIFDKNNVIQQVREDSEFYKNGLVKFVSIVFYSLIALIYIGILSLIEVFSAKNIDGSQKGWFCAILAVVLTTILGFIMNYLKKPINNISVRVINYFNEKNKQLQKRNAKNGELSD